MLTILNLTILSVILFFIINFLLLFVTNRIFKLPKASLKLTFKVYALFFLASILIGGIIGFLFNLIGILLFGELILAVGMFFVFDWLMKKYYQSNRKKNLYIYIVFNLLSLVVSLILILTVRSVVFMPIYISGNMMEPNLHDQQYALFSKYDKDYQRGAIIIFENPKNTQNIMVHRIVGLPGEKVVIQDQTLYINDQKLDESFYLTGEVLTWGQVDLTLAEDEYFVLGDNRAVSMDSRVVGPIKESLIKGKLWITVDDNDSDL